jgi:ubiquinone/menaquinone biosynthesis C-methylase UbiE
MVEACVQESVRKIFGFLGYDVVLYRKVDLSTYTKKYDEDSLEKRRFYNIGAGKFSHPYWTNIDYISEWYSTNNSYTLKGIQYDLLSLEHIPVESNSAEVIYSSHTIEHINNEAAQNMFNESYRMLKKGGILRLTTPNINLLYRAYCENDRDFFYWINEESARASTEKAMARHKLNIPFSKASISQIFLLQFASSASMVHSDGASERISDEKLRNLFEELPFEAVLDYCTKLCPIEIQRKYPGNHINWWNKDKMFNMLEKSGFKNIYLSGYGQSFCSILRDTTLFDKTYPAVSLYIEARR